MKHLYLCFTCIILCIAANIQAKEYPVWDIPDSLKIGAVSVVRENSTMFVQTDLNNATSNTTTVVTILSKPGDRHAYFSISCDKSRELSKFSGVVKDAFNKVVKKIKKSDLTRSDITYGGTFASDDYTLAYQYQPPSYPCTVEYTYEVKYKNGIINYPTFYSTLKYNQAVENNNLSIEIPSNINIRSKSISGCEIKEEDAGSKKIYSTSVENMKAFPHESLTPYFEEIIPMAFFAPNNFCYDGQCGDMTTWKDYGLWAWKLLEGRDALPNDYIAKLKDLTKDAKDDREKTKILYEFLQNNHRYVGIQFGIGGLQPFKAETVAKDGFGDCKGLSNLMRAMLKAVDIPSYYCEIYSGVYRPNFHHDFPSVTQTNHAILMVPFVKDTVWLECTSSVTPFGFVHDDIAGHDALVISKEGGQIHKLPSYGDEEYKTNKKLVFNINEDGSVKGSLELEVFLDATLGYNSIGENKERQVKHINQYFKLPKLKLDEIEITVDRSEYPSAKLKVNFETPDFINKTGNRLFLPLSPTTSGYGKYNLEKRIFDFQINLGFLECDTIIYELPEGYIAESLPKEVQLESEFGTFEAKTKLVENRIIYTQNIFLKRGRYDKNIYKDMKSYFTKVDNALKGRIVIRKQ